VIDVADIGADWVIAEVDALTDAIVRISPVTFNEENRYLPESVTPVPGYIRYDLTPYLREILDCFDVDSPVREVNVMKGAQVGYTTLLESGFLYYMAHVTTLPIMFMSADKELAKARVENNFIPMINESGFADRIRSSDEGNRRKTGRTANHIQFEGGGYMVPFGALNANKMRSYSIAVMLKDEVDAWPASVGRDGDPDKLSDARCSAYWERRKIFRGSTPLIQGASVIDAQYKRGDQRQYFVRCNKCDFPQVLRWSGTNKKTGHAFGFLWDYNDDGSLIVDSVRYACQNCGHDHFEADKEILFAPDHGAEWIPTASPIEPNIRSYHLPGVYSPVGLMPWSKCVIDYLGAYDDKEKKVKDIADYQVFYNNILAKPFEVLGDKVTFVSVSAHRRREYMFGTVPNNFAVEHAGGPIAFLVCLVDVHKSNLAVGVIGFTKDMRAFLVDYWRFKSDDCTESDAPAWQRVRELIEEKEYIADDGKRYEVTLTFIDAGYSQSTAVEFCAPYESGVFPIVGRDRPAKSNVISEFAEFETKAGTTGFRITVDHYKDRLAPVLRRQWTPEAGEQKPYHFNAPLDATDKQLKELTREYRREKRDNRGQTSHEWHRPGNAPNELFDLLVYGHAAAEVIAADVCANILKIEDGVDWAKFWEYALTPGVYYTDG